MIHPEAKFLSSCEPGKPGKLTASKILWWDKHRLDTTVQKGKNRDERRREKSQASPKPRKVIFIGSLSLENNPPWLYAPPLGTTEVAASPPQLCPCCCLKGSCSCDVWEGILAQWKQKELVLAPKPVVRVPAMIISESPLVSLLHFLDEERTFITKELHSPVL